MIFKNYVDEAMVKQKKFFSPILIIALTIFIDISGFGIVLPLIPFYVNNFGANSFDLGIIIASYSVMQFFFAPLLGWISDWLGRKPVLLISIFFSGLSFVLFATANSFVWLLLSRLVSGIATESAIARAYVADVTPEAERSEGLGKVGAAFGAGFVIGPVIGGMFSSFGFFGPGIVAALLTLVNFLFVFFLLPESLEHKTVISESPFENYLKPWRIGLNKPKVGLVLIINFVITLAFSAIPVILPLLGISFFGFNELEMSYFFMYIGIVQVLLQGFFIGKIVSKFGEETMIVVATFIMACGTFFVSVFANIALFVLSVSFISGGIGILNTVIPGFISKRSSSKEQGSGMGLVESVGSVARIFGPLIGGFMFEFSGLFFAFFLSTVFLLVAFALSCRVFQTCRL